MLQIFCMLNNQYYYIDIVHIFYSKTNRIRNEFNVFLPFILDF